MTATLLEQARARATVFHALAVALTEPVHGVQRELADAAEAGAHMLDSSACKEAITALAAQSGVDEGALREQYRRTMRPSGGRPPALYESLFREGRLAGPAAAQLKKRYRTVGLEATSGQLPDHASIELFYLAALAEVEAEGRTAGHRTVLAQVRREQREFLRQHAGAWLPNLGMDLAAGGQPFYRAVGLWLRGFLEEEMKPSSRHERQPGRLPALQEPEACTLCGFCVARCPHGALVLNEDASETRLVLNAAHCTACDLCVSTCPENVLNMVTYRVNEPNCPIGAVTPTLLRRSPRVRCPSCGVPTVSLAEVDGVRARLGAREDDELQQRLCLCVDCKAQLSWAAAAPVSKPIQDSSDSGVPQQAA